jgi:urease accessory protein
MYVADSVHIRSWRARLALDFERRGTRTVLAARRHDGPLVVQKPFYPEGDGVCHAIILHPPAGIAGGDKLEIAVCANKNSHTLLTFPGAAKWYRSAGPWAEQRITLTAGKGALLEWLPQETIVFDGALADTRTDVQLSGDAVYIGWEIACLGRTGSGERFEKGEYRLSTRLWRDDKLQWIERGRIAGGGDLLASPVGLDGCTVSATLLAAAPRLDAKLLAACREELPATGRAAITLLPGVLIARYIGNSSEAAKDYFVQLWRRLRPVLTGRAAVAPRIWNT